MEHWNKDGFIFQRSVAIKIQGVPKLVIQNQGVITQKAENLQYFDIYHKMQDTFKFYLQISTAVQCGLLVSRGRYHICKRFCVTLV
jgi:hypothetical protein